MALRIFNKEREKTKVFHNLALIEKTQPMGNIIFKENYIIKGDGYETCIHIYDYPENVGRFWLKVISDIEDVITTIDIGTFDSGEMLDKINNSLDEYSNRTISERSSMGKRQSAIEYKNMSKLHDDIYSSGEIMKQVHIRIYVARRKLETLEKDVKSLLAYLEGHKYKGAIFLNELEDDYKSLFNSITRQSRDFITKRSGKEIKASTLGAGYNYHYSNLDDPRGSYYGTSFTGGNVLLDLFHKDQLRQFYNGIILGKMGSGKSTLLKKIVVTELSKGNKIRAFDASGEFNQIAEAFNGKFISLDGTDGLINPLQVYRTSFEKHLSNEENDKLSYQKHLSKLDIFFTYLSPSLNNEDRNELLKLLNSFYEKVRLVKINGIEKEYLGITNKGIKEYPTMGEFLKYVEDISEKLDDNSLRFNRLDKLILAIGSIVDSYGAMFNGYSSLDIQNEDLVVFNIKSIGTLKTEIFNSVTFNVLNILWEEMIMNVSFGRSASKIDKDQQKYLVLIDEAHRLINSKTDESTIKFFTDFQREARKYLGGIYFSTHLLEDFVKGNSNSSTTMSEIFQLSQYKFIFTQDHSSKSKFKEVFNEQLTSSEIDRIPNFRTGECLLSISGFKNIAFKVSLGFEKEKKLLTTGGL